MQVYRQFRVMEAERRTSSLFFQPYFPLLFSHRLLGRIEHAMASGDVMRTLACVWCV